MALDLDKYTGQLHFADIEARGLWQDVHSLSDIWCLCSVTEDEEVILFHDFPEFDEVTVKDPYDNKEYIIPKRAGTLLEGFRYWYKIGLNKGKLVVHNCFTYDKPIIEKVVPKCLIPTETWHDTFIQSKMQWFDRPTPKGAKSPHGLKAFGIRFGVNKPEITDWTTMDAFKLHRCIEDCKIQKKTYEYLEKERLSVKDKLNIDFEEPLNIEIPYVKAAQKQEVRGVLADVDHMNKCVAWLDETTEVLASKIEPSLPATVKAKGSKVGRKELAEILGFKQKVSDLYDYEGEVVKNYYKPTVNFHRTVKGKLYTGFHISYGFSPSFNKKKQLTDWIKKHHPTTKNKEWEIEVEDTEVKVLNANTCVWFGVEPEDTDIISGSFTRVSFIPSTMSQHEVVKSFLIKLGLNHCEEWNLKKDKDKQVVRVEKDTWVHYPSKSSYENQLHFLCKKGEALVTSPKISEGDYEQLPEGLGKEIADYNTYTHRRRFLLNPKDPENKGLLAYVREDGRIPAGINVFGTSTSRSSHYVWVNAAGEGALFGEEIRKSLIAPEGRRLVGCDMKSAQLAIASYYALNKTYYEAVASGQEVVKDEEGNEIYVGESAHCFSARLFDLVSHTEWQEAVRTQDKELLHSIMLRRKRSKGASFGVIFGCSGKKLAGMLGIPEDQGNIKKKAFLDQMGLQGVADWLQKCKSKYKRGSGWYIPLPLGYWVFCKSDHKAINYLIQGTESVCQKIAVNYFEEKVIERGLDAYKVLDYHKIHCGFTQ